MPFDQKEIEEKNHAALTKEQKKLFKDLDLLRDNLADFKLNVTNIQFRERIKKLNEVIGDLDSTCQVQVKKAEDNLNKAKSTRDKEAEKYKSLLIAVWKDRALDGKMAKSLIEDQGLNQADKFLIQQIDFVIAVKTKEIESNNSFFKKLFSKTSEKIQQLRDEISVLKDAKYKISEAKVNYQLKSQPYEDAVTQKNMMDLAALKLNTYKEQLNAVKVNFKEKTRDDINAMVDQVFLRWMKEVLDKLNVYNNNGFTTEAKEKGKLARDLKADLKDLFSIAKETKEPVGRLVACQKAVDLIQKANERNRKVVEDHGGGFFSRNTNRLGILLSDAAKKSHDVQRGIDVFKTAALPDSTKAKKQGSWTIHLEQYEGKEEKYSSQSSRNKGK